MPVKEPSEAATPTEEPISSTPDPGSTQEPASFAELAAEAPETAAPPPSTWSDWREKVVQSGLNLPEDETQALEALREVARQNYQLQQAHQQLQQAAAYGQQVMPVWNEFQQWQAQRQQAAQVAQQQPAAPAKPSYWPKAPDYDPSWTGMVRFDEEAQEWVSKPGAQPDLPQRIRAYAEWKNQQLERLAKDPAEAIWGGLEERVQQQVDQRVQAALQQYDANQAASQFVQQNGEWLYQTDPMTGQAGLSPEGQALGQHLMYVSQIDPNNPHHRRDVAQRLLQGQIAMQRLQQLQAGQPAGGQPAQQAQAPHPNKPVNRIANRGGTVNAAVQQPSLPQNDKQTLKELLYSAAADAGLNGQWTS